MKIYYSVLVYEIEISANGLTATPGIQSLRSAMLLATNLTAAEGWTEKGLIRNPNPKKLQTEGKSAPLFWLRRVLCSASKDAFSEGFERSNPIDLSL